MSLRYRFPLILILLLVAGLTARLDAQPAWELASTGAEGAYLRTLYRTPAGTMLGATSGTFVRHDRSNDRWTETLRRTMVTERWSFASDRSGTIYAGANGDVLRSTDDGGSWSVVDTGATIAAIDGELVVLLGAKGRSIDGGATWQPAEARTIYAPAFASGRLIAASADILVESLDTGRTWRVLAPMPIYPDFFLPIDSATILAATFRNLYRSTDAGHTWSYDTMAVGAATIANDGDIYVSSFSTVFPSRTTDGLHRSTDKGATWTRVSKGVAEAIAAGVGDEIWASFGPYVSRSTDDAASWQRAVAGLALRGGTLYSGSNGAVYGAIGSYHLHVGNGGLRLSELMRTDDDGRSWQSLLDSVVTVATIPEGWAMFADVALHRPGGDPNGFVDRMTQLSTDGGATWRELYMGPLNAVASNATGVGVVYGRSRTGHTMLRTSDRGATWLNVPWNRIVTDLAVTETGSILAIVAVTDDGAPRYQLERSDDGGGTWRVLETENQPWQVATVGDDVVVLTYRELEDAPSRVLRSTDGGTTWTRTLDDLTALQLLDDGDALVVFAYDQDADETVFHRSTDSGATWQSSRHPAFLAAVDPRSTKPGEIFSHALGSIQRSTDHGTTWDEIEAASSSFPWISAATNDRVIIAAQHDRLYRATIPPASIAVETAAVTGRTLHLAPTHATSSVIVDAPCAGEIVVTDMRGTHALTSTVDAPGRHAIDIAGLSDGVYLVRMPCDGRVVAGRIVVRR